MTFTAAEEEVIGKFVHSGRTGDSVAVHWPKNCNRTEMMKEVERRLKCTAHNKPRDYFFDGGPATDGHCMGCHCICDSSGPHCGHWAGCPGC